MKSHLIKVAFAFSRTQKVSSAVVLLGLVLGSIQLLHGPQTIPAALDSLAHKSQGRDACLAARIGWTAPSHFGPHSKWTAFGVSPRKMSQYDTQKWQYYV